MAVAITDAGQLTDPEPQVPERAVRRTYTAKYKLAILAEYERRARINCIAHLLGQIPYRDLTPEPIALPPRQDGKAYVRPPMSDQTFVPEMHP